MNTINSYSRLTVLFTLGWQDAQGVTHQDSFWTDRVNLWRDCFPAGTIEALLNKTEGEKVSIPIKADDFIMPYRENKRVQLKKDNFRNPGSNDILKADAGRYYPQGFLQGVSGVFRSSIAPALCEAVEEDTLSFDLNHPLAGYDLELSIDIEKVGGDTIERGGRCEDWMEKISTDGPGMQARRNLGPTAYFTPENLQRLDASPDNQFYKKPRMVQHLDSSARDVIRNKFGELAAPNANILDLMASWDSHLPHKYEPATLTVLGLNEEELRANKKASDVIVQDLNDTSALPFAENSQDAVFCTASVEYLTDPLAVFAEIQRILAPGGVAAIAFSNRWFTPKAVKIWSEMHEFERLGMVLELFEQTPGFHNTGSMSMRGKPRPEDDPHPEYMLSDPVYVAWSYKKG